MAVASAAKMVLLSGSHQCRSGHLRKWYFAEENIFNNVGFRIYFVVNMLSLFSHDLSCFLGCYIDAAAITDYPVPCSEPGVILNYVNPYPVKKSQQNTNCVYNAFYVLCVELVAQMRWRWSFFAGCYMSMLISEKETIKMQRLCVNKEAMTRWHS